MFTHALPKRSGELPLLAPLPHLKFCATREAVGRCGVVIANSVQGSSKMMAG
jgi:hypothetical protein